MAHVPGRSSRNLARAATGLVVIGAILRVITYLQRPSLWLDEAMVALNIGRRSYSQLMAPLDYNQLAPVPWLWLEKSMVDLGGMHELALRAPALIAGVLLSWMVWRAGLHLVGEWGALVATALTATAATLLFYAAEAKPYAIDAALTAMLLGLGGRCLTRPIGDRSIHVLGAVGVAALLFSFPSVFVLGGLGIALLVRAGMARNSRAVRDTMVWGTVWLAIFALPQVLLYRQTGQGADMQQFWLPGMARLGEAGFLGRASGALNALVTALIGREVWPGTELYLLVLAFGAWTIAHKRGLVTMLAVITPLALLGLAWLLDQIPAVDRLFLFAAPILALLFGAAVAQVIHHVPFRFRGTVATILALLLGSLLIAEGYEGVTRPKASGGRELVHQIAASRHTPVWLTRSSAPVWVFYTTDWHAPDTTRLDWYASRTAVDAAPQAPVAVEDEARWSSFRGPVERIAWPSNLRAEYGGVRGSENLDQWARREVDHLVPLARSTPFMLILHEREPERDALQRAVELSGLEIISESTQKRGTLWRVGPGAQAPRTVSNSSVEPQR
jgi:hypothetical protein